MIWMIVVLIFDTRVNERRKMMTLVKEKEGGG